MDKFCGQRMPKGKGILLSLYSQQWCSVALLTPGAIVIAAQTFPPFVALGFISQVVEYIKLLLPNAFERLPTLKLFFFFKGKVSVNVQKPEGAQPVHQCLPQCRFAQIKFFLSIL